MTSKYSFKIFVFLIYVGLCSGCMLAPLVSSSVASITSTAGVESLAVSGASYAATGKGVSDHVISGVADQDCNLLNVFKWQKICQDYDPNKIPIYEKTKQIRVVEINPSGDKPKIEK